MIEKIKLTACGRDPMVSSSCDIMHGASMAHHLTIVVPAYNEAASLKVMLPQWLSFCSENHYKMIIVNDGSEDDTKKILESQNDSAVLSIIHHKVNRGYGAALKSGIRKADTDLIITFDADGQHSLADIKAMLDFLVRNDADMVIGSRENTQLDNFYRRIGKRIIRNITKLLMPLPVYDLNSGMKLYQRELVQKYLRICPDSMAFSDTITLIFINQGHLVLEYPITVAERNSGSSTITILEAFDTVWKILIVAMLFKPIKIFFPLFLICVTASIVWGLPIVLLGKGVSVGASVSFLSGVVFLFFGLLAEQLSIIIKSKL